MVDGFPTRIRRFSWTTGGEARNQREPQLYRRSWLAYIEPYIWMSVFDFLSPADVHIGGWWARGGMCMSQIDGSNRELGTLAWLFRSIGFASYGAVLAGHTTSTLAGDILQTDAVRLCWFSSLCSSWRDKG